MRRVAGMSFARMKLWPDGLGASFVSANDGFCKLVDMTNDEVMALYAKDPMAAVHPDDAARALAQVCAELLRLAPPRLHIMSCGPASLARDLDALTGGLTPRFRLVTLRAYDTLPHTPHLELVAWLEAVPLPVP